MRSAMNPIQAKMRMRIPNQSGMPAVVPPDMDDMPPGQGDMGMETMYPNGVDDSMVFPGEGEMHPEIAGGAPFDVSGRPPMGPPQAMPVHSMGEGEQFYKRMGKTMPTPMRGMTGTMEGTPEGPLRSKLHAAQHQMMAGDQKSAISMKRMELSSKKQQLESVIQSIRRGETMDQDGRLFNKIAAGISQIDGLLSQFPMEGQAAPAR